MENTKLNYLQDDTLTGQAVVYEISCEPDDVCTIVLDQTWFYPQGGGQPYDIGIIQTKDKQNVFQVKEVRFKDGIVFHKGTIQKGRFLQGDEVDMEIDAQRRQYNSRNHSAGHIVDIAGQLGGIKLEPGKGYHFPKGAYIEYIGTLPPEQFESIKKAMQEKIDELVEQQIPISVQFVTFDELKQQGSFIPDNIPTDKPLRSMKVEGYPAIPCGGTHAKNTKELKKVTIDKIKNKKGNLRVSYSVPE